MNSENFWSLSRRNLDDSYQGSSSLTVVLLPAPPAHEARSDTDVMAAILAAMVLILFMAYLLLSPFVIIEDNWHLFNQTNNVILALAVYGRKGICIC
jgi:hypothetical protein